MIANIILIQHEKCIDINNILQCLLYCTVILLTLENKIVIGPTYIELFDIYNKIYLYNSTGPLVAPPLESTLD